MRWIEIDGGNKRNLGWKNAFQMHLVHRDVDRMMMNNGIFCLVAEYGPIFEEKN